MSTHPTVIQMLAAAHTADLIDEARQAGLARAARTSEPHPGWLRTSTARLLVGLARRLDHRLGQVDEQSPLTAMAR